MYQYSKQKPHLFTEEGSRNFLKVRDHVHATLAKAGAIRMNECFITCGSSWNMLAYVDRLVELGEIREISQEGCAGQDRVFVKR